MVLVLGTGCPGIYTITYLFFCMFIRSLLPVFFVAFLGACEHRVVNRPLPEDPPLDMEKLQLRPEDRAIFKQEEYDSLREAYIAKYTVVAQAMMRKYGVPASVLLAQGLYETQAGTSKLARQNHNHFGIQCYSDGCNEGHCSNPLSGHMHKVHFRIYHNPWQGWEAHAQRLSRDPRYKKYLPQPGIRFNAYAWTRALQENGFSADRLYGEKLYNLIQQYNLEELDE